jgi:hypothetical protein
VVDEHNKALALSEIAAAQVKAGRRDEALNLFRKAIQILDGTRGRNPNRYLGDPHYTKTRDCLRTISLAQAGAGFATDAVRTAELIDDPKWKHSALAGITIAIAKAGDIEAAHQLFDRIADEDATSRAIGELAEGQVESGDIEGAVAWAKSRPTAGARANALMGVLRAIAAKPPGKATSP